MWKKATVGKPQDVDSSGFIALKSAEPVNSKY